MIEMRRKEAGLTSIRETTLTASLEFAITSDVASVTASVFSGSDVLLENGDVPVKATAPVYPDDYFLSDVANAGERLNISLRNNNAGTATVRSAVRIYPLG